MSKNRAFVKYTKSGKLIPGSLIITTNGGYPVDGVYKEVPTDLCCTIGVTISWSSEGQSFPMNYICVEISCDETGIFNDCADGTANTVSDLINFLNTNFSSLGTFWSTGNIVNLTLNEEYAKAVCPNTDLLTMNIYED